jgi:hypothetical protein
MANIQELYSDEQGSTEESYDKGDYITSPYSSIKIKRVKYSEAFPLSIINDGSIVKKLTPLSVTMVTANGIITKKEFTPMTMCELLEPHDSIYGITAPKISKLKEGYKVKKEKEKKTKRGRRPRPKVKKSTNKENNMGVSVTLHVFYKENIYKAKIFPDGVISIPGGKLEDLSDIKDVVTLHIIPELSKVFPHIEFEFTSLVTHLMNYKCYIQLQSPRLRVCLNSLCHFINVMDKEEIDAVGLLHPTEFILRKTAICLQFRNEYNEDTQSWSFINVCIHKKGSIMLQALKTPERAQAIYTFLEKVIEANYNDIVFLSKD